MSKGDDICEYCCGTGFESESGTKNCTVCGGTGDHKRKSMTQERKHIRSEADRRWPPSKIPSGPDGASEAFAVDHTRNCNTCEASPVVNATGLCGPCQWGESETAGGNW